MGSLLGSKGNKGSNTSQGSGSSSTVSSSSSSTNPGFMAELSQVLGKSLNGTSGFTRENALEDVQGLLKQQATDALQTAMPSIAKQSRSAGVYNATTTDLLQNDANARITAQLASTLTDTIGKYAAMDTDRIRGFAAATQAGTSSSSQSNSNSESEYEQSGSGSTSGGGSGILGLFADGGRVPNRGGNPMMNVMGTTTEEKIASGPASASLSDSVQQIIAKYGSTIAPKEVEEFKQLKGVYDLASSFFFADGGQVPQNQLQRMAPDNIWANARNRREEEAGLSEGTGGITINVNSGGGGNSQPKQAAPAPAQGMGEQVLQLIRQQLGFADGGQVPPQVAKALQSGEVRSGAADAAAGGKIRGPQTPDGKDNQIIAVGGGEGIIPTDVMDVDGVPELLQGLIQRYHTPVKQ